MLGLQVRALCFGHLTERLAAGRFGGLSLDPLQHVPDRVGVGVDPLFVGERLKQVLQWRCGCLEAVEVGDGGVAFLHGHVFVGVHHRDRFVVAYCDALAEFVENLFVRVAAARPELE